MTTNQKETEGSEPPKLVAGIGASASGLEFVGRFTPMAVSTSEAVG